MGRTFLKRIEHLPLILAGPILRRTESKAVTVWLTLKEPRTVTLSIYSTEAGKGEILEKVLFQGSNTTIPLGKYLHVVAVTAKIADSSILLEPGKIYAYDLSFGTGETLAIALNYSNIPLVNISYFEHQLPTFALAPVELNELKIAQGSCRKLHGGGRDALPMLDQLIAQQANQPTRLHQLFLTGDQIYGDDVANPLLWAVSQIGDELLGWKETLPFEGEAKPGERSNIARNEGGFTAMLVNKPECAKSHLFGLGEYYAMYLFAWSPIFWSDFPAGREIEKDPKKAKLWDSEVRVLQEAVEDLWKVRRALANVPTYMIFDDHDISDDWYLNRLWCHRVLSKPLGRRTVINGMLAYAVFQGWGNTPDIFELGSGKNLLKMAAIWSESKGTDEEAIAKISRYLGIPDLDTKGLPKFKLDEDVLILNRDYPDGTQSIQWHYIIKSFHHEVVVLDTRTWRGYPQDEEAIAPPMLLSPTGFENQICTSLKENNVDITLVILPTNLVSMQLIDLIQEWELNQEKVFNTDVGDSWNFNKVAFSRMLRELFLKRDRVIILSGDIHYSAAVRLNYWTNSNQSKVLAQLTSSAFKNAELKTYLIHTKAKSLIPEQPEEWVGWQESPELVEIQIVDGRVRIVEVETQKAPVLRQRRSLQGNWNIAWEIAVKNEKSLPDWYYHVEWIDREKAVLAWNLGGNSTFDAIAPNTPPYSALMKHPNEWLQGLKDIISLLWRNPWIQEGTEVIGHNNFGLISFKWSPENKVVIQDNYWRSPWKSNDVVYSRYQVSLQLDPPPPPPKII